MSEKVCEECGKCPTCGHRPVQVFQTMTTGVAPTGPTTYITTAQEPDCHCCKKDSNLTQAE